MDTIVKLAREPAEKRPVLLEVTDPAEIEKIDADLLESFTRNFPRQETTMKRTIEKLRELNPFELKTLTDEQIDVTLANLLDTAPENVRENIINLIVAFYFHETVGCDGEEDGNG